MRKHPLHISLLLALVAVFGHAEEAPQAGFFRGITAISGAHFEFWLAGKDNARELVIPLTVMAELPAKFGLDISAFYLNAGDKIGGTRHSLNGFSDVRARISYRWNDLILATAGFNIPAGRADLSADELPVSSVLSYQALEFRNSTLGQGFDVHGGLSFARQIDLVTIGASASMLYKGVYSPYRGSRLEYKPGNEYLLAVGADFFSADKKVKLMGDLSLALYGNDYSDGEKVFRSGSAISLDLQARMGKKRVLVSSASVVLRMKDGHGAGIIEQDSLNANGSEVRLQSRYTIPASDALSLFAEVKPRLRFNDGFDTGGFFTAALGGGGTARVTRILFLNANAFYGLGSVHNGGEWSFLNGFEVFAGVTVRIR